MRKKKTYLFNHSSNSLFARAISIEKLARDVCYILVLWNVMHPLPAAGLVDRCCLVGCGWGSKPSPRRRRPRPSGVCWRQSSGETLLHRHKNLGSSEMFPIFSATGQAETLPQHFHHGRTTPKGAVVLLEFTFFRLREKERCTCQYLRFELRKELR